MAKTKLNAKEIIQVTDSYKREAEMARRDRLEKNRLNWNVYWGKIDWSYKQPGQSTEHLPKMALAAEQVRAFVKKALVAFGQWYQVKVPNGYPLTPEQVQALMNRFLNRIVVARNKTQPVETIIANAIMQGLLESLVVLKVHGGLVGEKVYRVEPGDLLAGLKPSLVTEGVNLWRLRVDIVRTEDYFPDPTGRNLYRIHQVERDFMDVLEMADAGLYDMSVIEKLDDDFQKELENKRREVARNQNETINPRNRRRVVIAEGWGTILGPDGRPAHKDVVWAVANGKYLIRKPEPFPLWHGEDPFIEAPLVQNPHTVWSKALYDDVTSLNIALDELYNLIIDGGIASVWGVRQVRTDWLKDPSTVSSGIPQNATLELNDSAPPDGKVVEVVATGKVPPEALAVMNLTSQETNAASLVNDLRVGAIPQKKVLATEIMAADAGSNAMMDSLTSEVERNVVAPLLRKAWFTILQFADDIPAEDVVEAVGLEAAFLMSRLSAAERYAKLARADFNVTGLSATLAKARDFQKFMAMMQAVAMNPILLESFLRRMNGDKALLTMFRMLNINPEDFQFTEEEMKEAMARAENMAMLGRAGLGTGGGGGGNPSTAGSDRSLPNEARSDAGTAVESEGNFGVK